MTRYRRPLTALTALAAFTVALVVSVGVALAAEPGADKLRYSGTYEWSGGDRGPLDVTFMPDGDGGWEVSFRFRHGGRYQTWTGTALGDVGSGEIEGKVDRYRFDGAFEDGVFRGTHYEERRGGRLRHNGTLTFE